MVKNIGHFIGGQHVPGTSGRFADVYNPNTGEVQARVALANGADLRAAVENAKAAQPGWAVLQPPSVCCQAATAGRALVLSLYFQTPLGLAALLQSSRKSHTRGVLAA